MAPITSFRHEQRAASDESLPGKEDVGYRRCASAGAGILFTSWMGVHPGPALVAQAEGGR